MPSPSLALPPDARNQDASPQAHPDSRTPVTRERTPFDAALQHLEQGDTQRATSLLEQLDFEALPPEEAISARALALHLAVSSERYVEALHHADAALDLTEREPLIYNLLGQALWAMDHHRIGAEALVRAAELLPELKAAEQVPSLPMDAALVYFMAGEACKHYEQFEAALDFFNEAQQNAPENDEITLEISAVTRLLGLSRRVA